MESRALQLKRTLGLRRLPIDARSAMGRSMTRISMMMKDEGTLVLTGAKLKRKGLFLENMDPDRLAVRTGTLRKTLVSRSFSTGTMCVSVFGTTAEQIPILEKGGHIDAKGRALCIPTTNVMTPTGRLQDRWANLMAMGSLRDAGAREGIFVLKAKRRGTQGGWIAQRIPNRKGKGKESVRVLFLLRKRVNIVARHMLEKAMKRQMVPKATAIIGAEIHGGMLMASSGSR
jgi:hypothetical protein